MMASAVNDGDRHFRGKACIGGWSSNLTRIKRGGAVSQGDFPRLVSLEDH
jgi:hypothetical protein